MRLWWLLLLCDTLLHVRVAKAAGKQPQLE